MVTGRVVSSSPSLNTVMACREASTTASILLPVRIVSGLPAAPRTLSVTRTPPSSLRAVTVALAGQYSLGR